jgi:hypothetical protein
MQRGFHFFGWVGVFDSPITKTNNHKMDASKLKYYITLAFGLATYVNKIKFWANGEKWLQESAKSFLSPPLRQVAFATSYLCDCEYVCHVPTPTSCTNIKKIPIQHS